MIKMKILASAQKQFLERQKLNTTSNFQVEGEQKAEDENNKGSTDRKEEGESNMKESSLQKNESQVPENDPNV